MRWRGRGGFVEAARGGREGVRGLAKVNFGCMLAAVGVILRRLFGDLA